MKTCGTCEYFRQGKAILGKLWRGSICMNKDPECFKLIRSWMDRPATSECWRSQDAQYKAGVK